MRLTSLDTDGDAQHTSNQVGFDFGSFAHKHLSYDETGKADAVVIGDWSLGGKGGAPAPNAPADQKGLKLGEGLSTDAQLDYYVHFEGLPANEWLQLEGFSMGLNAAVSTTGGIGKTTADPVSLLLGSSASIVHLTDALAGGSVLKGVEIEAYLPGVDGKPQLVDQYYFGNVSLSSLDTSNASSNALTATWSTTRTPARARASPRSSSTSSARAASTRRRRRRTRRRMIRSKPSRPGRSWSM